MSRLLRLTFVFCVASMAACGGSPTRPSPASAVATTPAPTPTPTPPTTPTTPDPDPQPALTLRYTKFLAFGDSMTGGFSAVSSRLSLDPVTSYPSVLRQLLAQRYPTQAIQVDNAGRPGEWAFDGRYRLPEEIARYQPEVLLLMEGANDMVALGDRGVDVATAAIEAMVVDASRRGMVVFLATLPPQRPGGPRATFIDLLPRYNEWMRRIASDRGATLVDVYAAFGSDLSLISADGLHPSPEGYRVMAQAFADAITRTLQR